MEKPIIGITMGDPAGIGPELIMKVLSKEEVYEKCYPVVIGDPKVMGEASKLVGGNLNIRIIRDITDAKYLFRQIDVLCPEGVNIREIRWGKVDPIMGKAAALCLETVFSIASKKKLDGVVSGPLNKEAFRLAGYQYADDLEFLGKLTNSPEPFAMGVMESFWTIPVTLHIPFKEIVDWIKKERVLNYIQLMDRTLKRVGLVAPRIGVAALNVHASEGGIYGREEIDEISPSIEAAKKLNIQVNGPFPADTIFVRALAGEFDGVVCMYHDQATIARKLRSNRKGASFYMGLPVICGTTAYGTAFDIAGKGIADPGSMEDALKYTTMLSMKA